MYLEVGKLDLKRKKKRIRRPITKNIRQKKPAQMRTAAGSGSLSAYAPTRRRAGAGAATDKGDKFVNMTVMQSGACIAILLFGLFIKESSAAVAINLKSAITRTLAVSTNMQEIEVFLSDMGGQYEEIKEKAIEVFSGQKSIQSVFNTGASEEGDGEQGEAAETFDDQNGDAAEASTTTEHAGEFLPQEGAQLETFMTSEYVKEVFEAMLISSTGELPELIDPMDDYDTGEKRSDLPGSATMKYIELGISVKNPVNGELSCEYGYRIHPISKKEAFHYGVDVAAKSGTNITAIAPGTIKNVGKSNAYGNYVIVSHANGVESFYGHCSKILVKKGQSIKADTVLARVGSTGFSTGSHLHVEITKNAINVDPLYYLDY